MKNDQTLSTALLIMNIDELLNNIIKIVFGMLTSHLLVTICFVNI